MKNQSNKNAFPLQWTMWYFLSDENRSHFSEQCGTFFSYGYRLLKPFNYCMQWNLNPTKTPSHFSKKHVTFLKLWKQNPLQWKMWYFFSVMDTDYSTPLITVSLWYLFTLYIVYISFPSVQMHKNMNETRENMVSYYTSR